MKADDTKIAIRQALAGFATDSLDKAATGLFNALGYVSERDPGIKGLADLDTEIFKRHEKSDEIRKKAELVEWKDAALLFQITDAEIRASSHGALEMFRSENWDPKSVFSFLFMVVELKEEAQTRTKLAQITRAVNQAFAMPAIIVFKHKALLSLAVIDRRLNKMDSGKDVLEKVTLIKDVRYASPHRAHVDILFDLSLGRLLSVRPDDIDISDFQSLHKAWKKTLDIQALNKRFFTEIRNWFYWSRLTAKFPAGAKKDADDRDSEALIRLLTRMIFCWFLHEKKLIPENFFAARTAEGLLKDWKAADIAKDKAGRYYKAILQNLFFATLATPVEDRKFRSNRSFQGKNKHFGDQRFFRHVDSFSEKAPVEELYRAIPFLNGGLFENLDEIPGRDPDVEKEVRVDGFSDVSSKQPLVPDFLFFGDDKFVPELDSLLGEKGQKARGLLRIFQDYKFTIEENTPLEEDIALDPELLGRAFENLLAAVNPETGTVARKSTGSFYTPREIVHYMVEEALFRYLFTALGQGRVENSDLEERLRELVSEKFENHRLTEVEVDLAIGAVSRLKILDPACGSGAFPMGLLQLLVQVLRKLDHNNVKWKAVKLALLPSEMRKAADAVFQEESFDYTRKLELIRDCIHGVDIQAAAIQISKLRFFLSLVIEQRDTQKIRPLPNLETKFVCANALLGLQRPIGFELFQFQIEPKERALLDTRARYFVAQTKEEKDACKAEDRRLRKELSAYIESIGGSAAKALASSVATWDPYHGDRRASYFDPESMFGVRDGFDITIGNPPYVRADEQSDWNQIQRKEILASGTYETLWEKWDLFVPFIEKSYKFLRPNGISTMIVSDAFCHSKYAQKSQNWFLRNSKILRLDFCADVKIFDAAVKNVIYFFQKADSVGSKPDRRVHHKTFGNVSLLPSDVQEKLTYRVFFPQLESHAGFSAPTLPIGEICYLSYGLAASSDEKLHKGEFVTEDVTQDSRDRTHPKPWVEGKLLSKWLPLGNRWLEWGTRRAPAHFRRVTFEELFEAPEKILIMRVAGSDLRSCYDSQQLYTNHTSIIVVQWHALEGVRNKSLKKVVRYRGEKPPRPTLPKREELEARSRRFDLKYLLAVVNSSTARDYLLANRRSNTDLYPDDWKKLPIPDISLSAQTPIVDLVERILDNKRANPNFDVTVLEAELNRLVAALYGIVDIGPANRERVVHSEQSGKDIVRDEMLPKIRSMAPYFNLEQVRKALGKGAKPIETDTSKRYLQELIEGGFVFDAGKGWYCSLAEPLVLDPAPVIEVAATLKAQFPKLDFICWSTQQLVPYMQHLLAKHLIFVSTDRSGLETVGQAMEEAGYTVHVNPGKPDAKKVVPGDKVVVLRPSVSQEPSAGPVALAEKVMVDLYIEAEKLKLMDGSEVGIILKSMLGSKRAEISKLFAYVKRRELELSGFLEGAESLFYGFSKKP